MAQTDKKTGAADKARLTTRVRIGKDTYGPGDEWLFASRSDVTDEMIHNLTGRKITTGDWAALRAKIAAGEAAPAVENALTDSDKDTEIAELEQSLETAQEAYDTVKAERDEAQAEVRQLTAAALAMKSEYQTVTGQLAERTQERDGLQADKTALEVANDCYRIKVGEQDETIAFLTAERDKLKGDLNHIVTGERQDTPGEPDKPAEEGGVTPSGVASVTTVTPPPAETAPTRRK